MPIKKHDENVKKLEEMEQNWKRALADYQNLVKRTQDQQSMMRNFACLNLIERLLPVLDHLDLAAKHLKDAGLDMVVTQLHQALEAEGVKKIEVTNMVFDPQTMECVEMVDGPENQVIEVVASGYQLQNRVLRAAKVKVGSKKINVKNSTEEV